MSIQNTLYVDLEISTSKEEFELSIEEAYVSSYIDADVYEGQYTVTPSFEIQTLQTKNKVLTNDIAVNAIEVSRVSNLQGGKTVYIGGIINA